MAYSEERFDLSSIGAKAFHNMIRAVAHGIQKGKWTKVEGIQKVIENVPTELQCEVGIALYLDHFLNGESEDCSHG